MDRHPGAIRRANEQVSFDRVDECCSQVMPSDIFVKLYNSLGILNVVETMKNEIVLRVKETAGSSREFVTPDAYVHFLLRPDSK
jgi:hypothetical protein